MRTTFITGIVVTGMVAALAFGRIRSLRDGRRIGDVTAYGRSHAAVTTETATFAAGCFWKLEHAMRQVDGVVSTTAGYTGGTSDVVDHATVSAGSTGHAEAVRVVYDPQRVSYDRLLDVFWASHDPTRFATEAGDPPPPGRSTLFYHTDNQRAAAEASKQRLQASERYSGVIPTAILLAGPFHRAEPEHQQYLENHATGSCRAH